MFQVRLKVLGGTHDGRTILLKSPKFIVGRERDCHLRPKSDLVSRYHCVFVVDEHCVRLRDMESRHGTFVNKNRVEGEVVLNDNDRVEFADLQFRVKLAEITADQLTEPTTVEPPPAEFAIPAAPTPDGTPAPAQPPFTTAEQAGMPPGDPNAWGQQHPGWFYPPQMPWGYPMPGQQMPGQQPPGQMPGYPGMPMPPGFPQMPMDGSQAGYPYPGQPPQPAEQPPAESPGKMEIPVKLPDPEDTGVKED